MFMVWLVCWVVLLCFSSSLRPSDDRTLDEDSSAASGGTQKQGESENGNATAPQLKSCTCCQNEVFECNVQVGYACYSTHAQETEEAWKEQCCMLPQQASKFLAKGNCNSAASTPALQEYETEESFQASTEY
eukprot:TRINITY_DN61214_c0_g1_i1.p1 TRINITY_DN61214_c0_g1~~TRINITY_DN61214_c0_g1_i1.p1  ORF type:complete len:132 (+),score=16.48 TRINITY_DN61214_c0_g1_i1:39-434(+)